jgi:hypothetical protein
VKGKIFQPKKEVTGRQASNTHLGNEKFGSGNFKRSGYVVAVQYVEAGGRINLNWILEKI